MTKLTAAFRNSANAPKNASGPRTIKPNNVNRIESAAVDVK